MNLWWKTFAWAVEFVHKEFHSPTTDINHSNSIMLLDCILLVVQVRRCMCRLHMPGNSCRQKPPLSTPSHYGESGVNISIRTFKLPQRRKMGWGVEPSWLSSYIVKKSTKIYCLLALSHYMPAVITENMYCLMKINKLSFYFLSCTGCTRHTVYIPYTAHHFLVYLMSGACCEWYGAMEKEYLLREIQEPALSYSLWSISACVASVRGIVNRNRFIWKLYLSAWL
jgi:hypothetical protein